MKKKKFFFAAFCFDQVSIGVLDEDNHFLLFGIIKRFGMRTKLNWENRIKITNADSKLDV